MSNSCPVLTPAERKMADIVHRADKEMMASVMTALDNATKQAMEAWQSEGTTESPPPYDYFASVVHQRIFLLLCGADPETMKGGDPVLAGHLIRNQQNIVEHYWRNAHDGIAR